MNVLILWSALGTAAAFAAPLNTPAPEGWEKSESTRFEGESLYGHIDGGAELYLELGFVELTVEGFRKGTKELTLEHYLMKDPEAALAAFLALRGKETPVEGVAARSSGSRYQMLALKGRSLVQVLNPAGENEMARDMKILMNSALNAVKLEQPNDLFSVLTQEDRVKGSEFLVRGQYGMQNIFYLGNGDILGLERRRFAVGADYQGGKLGSFTRVVVDYGDDAAAKAALTKVRKGLDPTLKPTWSKDDSLAFQDAQGKFGRISRSRGRVELIVHLAEQPKEPAR